MTEQNVKSRPDGQFDPRDIQAKNVSGSTAGAGSGDFHVYRQQRRIELDRIAKMEEEARETKEKEELFHAAEERRMREVNKTQKRAAKRKRKKELRQNRKKLRPGVEAIQPGHITIDNAVEQNQRDDASRDSPQGNDSHNNGNDLNPSDDATGEKNQERPSNTVPPRNPENIDEIRNVDDGELGNARSEQADKA